MSSPLSFDATKVFRDKLITRNLPPYKVDGSFSPPTGQQNYEIEQRDLEVKDSPDTLISNNPFANVLYTKNSFGPSGGFDMDVNVNNLAPVKPNQGPYSFTNTKLDKGTQDEYAKKNTDINLYLNPLINQGGPRNAIYSSPGAPLVPRNEYTGQRSQPYPNFNLSNSYTPYSILFNNDTSTLSQDSALQQIGAKSLKKNLEDRVAREIEQRTIARINIIPALQDPVTAVQVVSGKIPAVEGDYQITRASNPVVAAADLGLRLNGTYFPASTIPGSYFRDEQVMPSPVNQITNAFNSGLKTLGGAFGLNLKSISNEPSQIFINNTGSWTRGRIFYNLNFNRYKPFYSLGIVDDVVQSIGNAVTNLFNLNRTGGFYVGSDLVDPSRITSPAGEIPINEFGVPDISNVYGPDKLAKEFEGQSFNFGMGGKSSTDADGNVDGGFVWTSPKYKDNAGFRVGPGGAIGSQDPQFPKLQSRYDQNSSSDKDFRQGSILDKTQRIINSQPSGRKRLSHAGNAIDQVSKVFHDGYKEITKGSKVKSFLNDRGEAIIRNKKPLKENEYCRLFTKDTPYYTYDDLQKKDRLYRSIDGLTTYSILDNVYNLNIAPTETVYNNSFNSDKGLPSTRTVKRYMFSIENLAWRTSNRPGYRVSDLPECERGPNGGRVMWFPPYNLSVNENVSTSWNPTTFLGRPEPVYTYKDTNRTGTLSFSIIVDHPSILNLIVNKYLEKEAPERVNEIVDSFFAGCLKYDLYDLAKVYNTIPPDQLLNIQEILGSPEVTEETVYDTIIEIPTQKPTEEVPVVNINFDEYKGLSFYFDNDIPKRNTPVTNYASYFNSYIQQQSKYKGSAGTFFSEVIVNNFTKIEENGGLRKKLFDTLSKDPQARVVIDLEGSASAPATVNYNQELSERRIESVINYFRSSLPGTSGLTEYIDNGRLRFIPKASGETRQIPISAATGQDTSRNYIGNPINCTEDIKDPNQKIVSVQAAACRAVRISNINYTTPPPAPTPTPTPQTPKETKVPRKIYKTRIPRQRITDYKGLTKKVIRYLLSECDYFKVLQAENPFIYNSMKDKIKYFNPTFHSMTPEGLNGRLTFLQQCMRPGDTIPTINSDGTLSNNDAYNTAFGSPPVLVLRIGDFFNTKVLCNSLSISYEPFSLDLNPEGIGVQPMLAKISMGITFIGGSGLKEPVEQLQNALSFNYYANTEIYDDRAEATEDTTKFDEKFYEQLKAAIDANEAIETPQQEPPKVGGDAIGALNATSNTGGTINYREIMNTLLKQTNSYFSNTYNKLKEVVENYNYGILQIFNEERNYRFGNFFEYNSQKTSSEIFGKSEAYQNKILTASNRLVEKIRARDLPIQKELDNIKNITDVDKRNFSAKLYEYFNFTLLKDFDNKLTLINQDISNNEIDLIQTITKINYVMTDRDGKVDQKGVPTIYKISADTSTVNSFKNDYKTIATGMTSYLTKMETDKLLTKKKDYDSPDDYVVLTDKDKRIPIKNSKDSVSFKDNNEKNFYLFFAQTILNKDKLDGLIDFLTKPPNGINLNNLPPERLNSYNKFKEMVTNCFQARVDLYKEEQSLAIKLFDDKKLDYTTPSTPFQESTDRVYNYELFETASNDDKTRLIGILYTSGNLNASKETFNGKKRLA